MPNLELRGKRYSVTREIPPSLRSYFGGKQRFKKALGTDSEQEAHSLSYRFLADWEGQIRQARRAAEGAHRGPLGEALGLRWELAQARLQDERDERLISEAEALRREELEYRGEAPDWRTREDTYALLIGNRAEELSRKHGEALAVRFAQVASGEKTLLSAHVEGWLAEAKGIEKTKGQHRKALRVLQEVHHGEVMVEDMDQRAAGKFLMEHLQKLPLSRKTKVRYLSTYSMMWKWMIPRGLAKENIWLGLAPPQKDRREEWEEERAFTDAEMVALFKAPPDATLGNLMAMAALSGMRIEELCRLRVRDCEGGGFKVAAKAERGERQHKGKTAAARREVPIHPELLPVVARRTAGKDGSSFLFDELSEGDADGNRSAAVSKRFGRYREAVGVVEHVEGVRRSLVNFHSFRRWFNTKAVNSGSDRYVLKRVMGHKVDASDMTERYLSEILPELKRKVVEAVRLPKGVDLEALAVAPPVRPKVRRKPVAVSAAGGATRRDGRNGGRASGRHRMGARTGQEGRHSVEGSTMPVGGGGSPGRP